MSKFLYMPILFFILDSYYKVYSLNSPPTPNPREKNKKIKIKKKKKQKKKKKKKKKQKKSAHLLKSQPKPLN